MITIVPSKARRRACLLAASLLCAVTASAAEPRSFAAISLIADEMRMVGQEATTGSALSRNEVLTVPIAFELIELHALKAVAEAILQADAVATVAPVKITDARHYARQSSFVDGARASLPDDLLRMLRNGKVSHLVLLSKYRSEARMNAGTQTLGSGTVEGLGYYVDRETAMRRRGENEVAQGFLAPYAYLGFSLIDVATLAVVRTETVTESQVLTAIGTKVGRDPWDVLSPAEKVESLRRMVREQVELVVPMLLAGS